MLPNTVKKYFVAILQEIRSSNPVLMTEMSDILFKTIELTRDIQKKMQLSKQNKGLIAKLYGNIATPNQLDVKDDIDRLIEHISMIETKIMQFEEPARSRLKDTLVRHIKQELQNILSYEEKLSEAELAVR